MASHSLATLGPLEVFYGYRRRRKRSGRPQVGGIRFGEEKG